MHILYATDGSENAVQAGRLLEALPFEADTRLTILTVIETPEQQLRGQAAIDASREALSHTTGGLRTEMRTGHPADEILEVAETESADVIVVGETGLSRIRRFLVGSVAERVVRHAPCSVLLVRPHGDLKRVLVAVDASRSAAAAVEWLRDLPLPPDCEVRLLTVLQTLHLMPKEHLMVVPPLAPESMPLAEWERRHARPRLDEMAERLSEAGRRVVTEIRSGDPADQILRAAEDEAADLIVVGSHDQGALERFLLGSVSENVLRHAKCSVLVVRERPGA